MEWLTDPSAWVALVTLTVLEIVLGIDNIVFISILTSRLPGEQQAKARALGLGLALIGRVLLLLAISWVTRLTTPLFTILEMKFSGRDLILAGGGLFLLWKATHEIHASIEGDGHAKEQKGRTTFGNVLVQILILDLVFSLDSVITAVGMADDVGVMITAIVIAIAFMMFSARAVSDFIQRHPTVKMLALSFLLLVGVALVADGLDFHIPRGFIYFAMAFSVFVEFLNLKQRSKASARTDDSSK